MTPPPSSWPRSGLDSRLRGNDGLMRLNLAIIKLIKPLAHVWLALAAIVFIPTAQAQPATPGGATAPEALADRMHRLTQDLRCLVCQNESLADSHAPLAMDLKREILALMAQGQSDAQIRDFLTQRYGDFVNYQPPLRPGTWLLWAGPLLLLAAGGWLVWRTVRASTRSASNSSTVTHTHHHEAEGHTTPNDSDDRDDNDTSNDSNDGDSSSGGDSGSSSDGGSGGGSD